VSAKSNTIQPWCRVCLAPAWFHHVARVPPQDALQLLDCQPASEASTGVFLGPLDERLTEALVESGVALVVRVGELLPTITHGQPTQRISGSFR
jgi:hypothetical protein